MTCSRWDRGCCQSPCNVCDGPLENDRPPCHQRQARSPALERQWFFTLCSTAIHPASRCPALGGPWGRDGGQGLGWCPRRSSVHQGLRHGRGSRHRRAVGSQGRETEPRGGSYPEAAPTGALRPPGPVPPHGIPPRGPSCASPAYALFYPIRTHVPSSPSTEGQQETRQGPHPPGHPSPPPVQGLSHRDLLPTGPGPHAAGPGGRD